MQAVRGAAGRRARNGLRIREAAAHTGRRTAEERPEGERRLIQNIPLIILFIF